jgi:hypothetical protein
VRGVRLAAAAVLLLVAVAAALFAQDIRSWRNTLDDAAARYAVNPSGPQVRTTPTVLPAGVSERLLAVERHREFLSTLRQFAIGYHIASTVDPRYLTVPQHELIGRAMAALSTSTQIPDPKRASQAFNLLALLELSQLRLATADIDVSAADSAVANFQNAIRADEANTAAKVNLELELRSLAANPQYQALAPGAGEKASGKRKGAKGNPTGTGY